MVTVLVSAFAPFPTLSLTLPPSTELWNLIDLLVDKYPTLPAGANLRLAPISRPCVGPATQLSELVQQEDDSRDGLVSFRLYAPILGGKGGFGSQLRAAGGRMSSQKTSNNDSCRDLSGRRLSTLKQAKQLAAYLEAEPARKKAEVEARKAKLEALEKHLGLNAGGSKDLDKDGKPVLSAGVKRARFDDTEYLEQSQVIKENVKSAVVAGLLKKRRKAKTESNSPPTPSTSTSTVKPTRPSTTASVSGAKLEAPKVLETVAAA